MRDKRADPQPLDPEVSSSPVPARRRIVTGGLAAGAATVLLLPGQWTRPIVQAVVLPVHAQTSGPCVSADEFVGLYCCTIPSFTITSCHLSSSFFDFPPLPMEISIFDDGSIDIQYGQTTSVDTTLGPDCQFSVEAFITSSSSSCPEEGAAEVEISLRFEGQVSESGVFVDVFGVSVVTGDCPCTGEQKVADCFATQC